MKLGESTPLSLSNCSSEAAETFTIQFFSFFTSVELKQDSLPCTSSVAMWWATPPPRCRGVFLEDHVWGTWLISAIIVWPCLTDWSWWNASISASLSPSLCLSFSLHSAKWLSTSPLTLLLNLWIAFFFLSGGRGAVCRFLALSCLVVQNLA